MITAVPVELPDDVAWDTGRGVRVPRDPRPSALEPSVRAALFHSRREAEEFVDCIWSMVVGPKCKDAFTVEDDSVPDGMVWVCLTGGTANMASKIAQLSIVWANGKLFPVLNS